MCVKFCKAHSKRSIILINLRILMNIIDYVGRQGQYIDIGEVGIKILILASIISNDFDIFTRLRNRRVVMCLVLVFVHSLIQLRVFNIF